MPLNRPLAPSSDAQPAISCLDVSVGADQIRLYSAGSGSPTIVCDPGRGQGGQSWETQLEILASLTRAVSYDRVGLGASPASNATRLPSATAHRLRAALQAADIPGPYILVGHSLGGLHVRTFAYLWPELVAGLVLVDPSHERMLQRARELWPRTGGLVRTIQGLTQLGQRMRLVVMKRLRPDSAADLIEAYGIPQACLEVQGLRQRFGGHAVPVIVLSATKIPAGERVPQKVLRLVHELHADIAELSPNGQHRFVDVDHAFINVEQGRSAVLDAVATIIALDQEKRENQKPA